MQFRYSAEAQFIAPVHVNHHDKPTENAGYLVPTDVREVKLSDGTELWSLIVDIFKIPAAIYALIKSNRLAYRSVEVIKYAEREIGSLALMADEVPHFRYALTTVGVEIDRAEQPAAEYAVDKPFMFRNGGTFMADEEKKKEAPPKDAPAENEISKGDGGEEKKPDALKDDEAKRPEDGGENPNQFAATVAQGLVEMKTMLTAIFALLSGAGGAMAGNGNPTNLAPVAPVAQMKATDTAESEKEKPMDAAFVARLTALEASTAAVAAGLKAQADAAEAEKRFKSGMDELAGRFIPETVKKSLAELSKGPEATFKATLEIVKSTLPYDPVRYEAGAVFAASPDELPEEVKKRFVAGTKEGEKALKEYNAFKAHVAAFGTKGPEGKVIDFDRFQKIEAMRLANQAPTPGRN